MVGYRFESDALVDEILAAVEATPGSLPLLQFAATKLWDARDRDEHLLTEASYRAIGGIEGALASHADQVMVTVSRLSPRAPRIVQAVFQRLVTPDRTRAITPMAELHELAAEPGAVQAIVDRLVDARLLVVHTGDEGQGAGVEIVHDSLIHNWPRLRRWLDDNEEDAAFSQQLRQVARQWDQRGRPHGLLWRGEAMDEARRWRSRFTGNLSRLERDYLDAAFALAERSQRVKRWAIIGTIGLLSVLVAAAAVALVLIRNAEQKALAAKAEVTRQLDVVKARESERDEAREQAAVARSSADVAHTEAAQSKQGLARANAELERKLVELEQAKAVAETNEAAARNALDEAERARRRAQDEAERARRAAGDAERARKREVDAKAEAQRLLEKEKQRNRLLNKKLGELGSDTLK